MRRTDPWRPFVVSLALGAVLTTAPAAAATAQRADAVVDACGPDSLLADLGWRTELPQTDVAPSAWYQRISQGSWGPRAATYPAVEAPAGCSAVEWKRARVVAIARQYLGLPYRHHHIPGWSPPADLAGSTQAGPGLDCSNFSAWVYNFGLGLRFTSDIHQQADGALAPGRLLGPDEPLAPGDLLFILRGNRADVSHVVIYVDEHTVIDSHGTYGGVTEHPLDGWYRSHYSHARRVLE
jgi:cell wall-associated NlpC family hydrolase